MISQVSATIKDEDLLSFLKMVNGELTTLIDKHDVIEYAPDIPNDFTPVLELGNHKIEAVTFVD